MPPDLFLNELILPRRARFGGKKVEGFNDRLMQW